jgi:twitching motility protein PilT
MKEFDGPCVPLAGTGRVTSHIMSAIPLERDAVLRRAVELGASDLLITAAHPIMVTLGGTLQALPGSPILDGNQSRRLAESFLTPALHEKFLRDLELDSRYHLAGVANFRVNVFIQRGQWGAAVRVVPLTIPLPSELGLAPHLVSRVLGLTHGLVLITGPTGAGKSTTIASLLEQVNQGGARRHIVTVEDPIEFVFEPKNAVIDQREVGSDTKSYARGLKSALRQLPHIIFVGEMRDLASMAIALTAAETGNLVISTMATQSAAQTVTRIIDSFPPHQQSQTRSQLSLSLRAVISQVLLPRAEGKSRVAAREVMFVNNAIQNLIREDKIHQIPNVISTSVREDMVPLDEHLAELVDRGVISFDTAYPYFEDAEKRTLLQKRYYRVAPVREPARAGS